MTPRLRRLLKRRLAAYAHAWPDPVASDLSSYLGLNRPPERSRSVENRERYWTELPVWLLADRRFAPARRAGHRFLEDVLWGQYCLFLFVRMHDDLLDQQSDRAALVFAADGLLVESQRAFATHLDGGPFWPIFRDLLDRSVRAILEVDALQRHPGRLQADSLRAYADVASIFKAGAAAVCAKSRRTRDLRLLGAFADSIAIANQIVDDLSDVYEDLDRGRFNFAANRLGIDGPRDDPERRLRVAIAVLTDDAIGGLTEEVEQHLRRAATAAARFGLAGASAYVARMLRNLPRFRAHVHRRRVLALLGPLMNES